MACSSSSRGSKNCRTCPQGRTAVWIALALLAAGSVSGCGGGGTVSASREAADWGVSGHSKPAAGLSRLAGEPADAGRPFEYRGGRDPVTGRAQTAFAPPDASGDMDRTVVTAPKVIEIRRGDTLHGLSLTHHVSVKALMAANNLTSAKIRPGQKLVVPAG